MLAQRVVEAFFANEYPEESLWQARSWKGMYVYPKSWLGDRLRSYLFDIWLDFSTYPNDRHIVEVQVTRDGTAWRGWKPDTLTYCSITYRVTEGEIGSFAFTRP
jgi:hypothetical protein